MTGGNGASSAGLVYYYYICNRRRVHKCQKKRIQKARIEQLILNKLIELIYDDEFVNEVADKCIDFPEREKNHSVLCSLEARQKENEIARNNLLAAIEAGVVTPSVKSRLLKLEAERMRLEKSIAREIINTPDLNKEQVIYLKKKFRDGDTSDNIFCAFLADTLLNAAYLYDDNKLVLILNYTGERCKVTLKLVEKAIQNYSCFASCLEL